MRTKQLIRNIILLCIVCMVTMSCGDGSSSSVDYTTLIAKLKEGDLLFRRGTGVVGHIVTSADEAGEFSHVGIVVNRDSCWHVVHAVPHEHDFEGDFDRVKIESIEHFLGYYPDATIGLYRTTLASEQVAIAVRCALRLGDRCVPFDHDYDLDDTTHLYCTELVEYAYSLAGISLSEGRRTKVNIPSLTGYYIMPSDLTRSSYLKPIY